MHGLCFLLSLPARVCPRGQVFSDCVSSCPPTCASPQPPGSAATIGQCREECVGGCECPPGLYLHQGLCLKRDDCPCFHRRHTYQSGDRIQQRCNTWWGWNMSLWFTFYSSNSHLTPTILFPVCAEQASGSVLGRSAQRSAALWGRYRWTPLTKRGIHYKEETVPSPPWRWDTENENMQVAFVCVAATSPCAYAPCALRTLSTGSWWWVCAVGSAQQDEAWVVWGRCQSQHCAPQSPSQTLVS